MGKGTSNMDRCAQLVLPFCALGCAQHSPVVVVCMDVRRGANTPLRPRATLDQRPRDRMIVHVCVCVCVHQHDGRSETTRVFGFAQSKAKKTVHHTQLSSGSGAKSFDQARLCGLCRVVETCLVDKRFNTVFAILFCCCANWRFGAFYVNVTWVFTQERHYLL